MNSICREFKLILTENKDIFSPGFNIQTVGDNGVEPFTDFDPHGFLKGIVAGTALKFVKNQRC